MSRIGRMPIPIPSGVEVKIGESEINVKGPKGQLSQYFNSQYVAVEKDDKFIYIKSTGDSKNAKAMHGLYRSLVNNAVIGVSQGFSKVLQIEGVGYKASVSGKKLTLTVGFSHDVIYNIPDGVNVETDKRGIEITVSGIDKQLVGLVASQIRAIKPPEPYKGKGIRYKGEYVRRKMGKAASK
ncbi:50S ribosomal protein L6 [Hippea maritima]|uniref:Large ribosomal subunit protein uL6 n=1 Tax=Hippea maritima (strain ATCC 700847 / DSM 10411 / MH2) TaxID=760142 RepID=F2LXS7_HIPMA|nr:50S ribosomal protein L6 [Hippea maritima]AEA34318.1 ribosomal protein L6 [Hippea maritima DSM 10411]